MMLDGTWGYVEVKPYGERGICVLVMVSGSPQVEVQSTELPTKAVRRGRAKRKVVSSDKRRAKSPKI